MIKLGATDDADPNPALLERILFFNNSLRTRSPLFRGFPAPPIVSYNNAVQFTGCGAAGAVDCKQDPENDPACAGKQFWTTDRKALIADCFPLVDAGGRGIPHRMRNNTYNLTPERTLDVVDDDRGTGGIEFKEPRVGTRLGLAAVEAVFAISEESSLARAGCALHYGGGDLECVGAAAPAGALLPNGKRFDLSLPFGFPFRDVLTRRSDDTRAR